MFFVSIFFGREGNELERYTTPCRLRKKFTAVFDCVRKSPRVQEPKSIKNIQLSGMVSRKKVAVLLDFVSMRGGGPCPNFLSTFHKLYIRVDRHSRTCKKKIIQPISVPSGVPRRGCSSFFCSNTLPSFATDTYK